VNLNERQACTEIARAIIDSPDYRPPADQLQALARGFLKAIAVEDRVAADCLGPSFPTEKPHNMGP